MPKRVLNNVKPNNDAYSVDKVNCFEKPLGILLDSYNEKFSSIFYMFVKLSYFQPSVESSTSESPFSNGTIKNILETRFNLKFESYQPADIHSFIKESIDSHAGTLVPGNLKELFYSRHYKESDWDHLFLVTGYDDYKEIYFIIDAAQRKIPIYEEFAIPCDMLEKMYTSYLEVFGKENFVYTVRSVNNNRQVQILDLIITCIDTFLNLEKGLSCKETMYIEDVLKKMEAQEYDTAVNICNLLNIQINYKEVFYTELVKNVSGYLKNTYLLENLANLSKPLIMRWSNIANICMLKCSRRKLFTVSDKVQEAKELEKNLADVLLEINKQLVQLVPEYNISDTPESVWIFENNADRVISAKDSSCVFNFHLDKEYNSWFSDDAPKVILKSFDTSSSSFEFTTRHSFTNSDPNLKFHAGIVFRDSNNNLYFWGSYCDNCLWLEKIGEDSKLNKIDIEGNTIILGIRKSENTYYFEYSFSDEGKMMQAYKIDSINQIQQIGLGCKTWGTPGQLCIEFNNSQIKYR